MPTDIANSLNIQTVSSATQVVASTASSNSSKQAAVPLPGSGSLRAESSRQILPAGKASTPEPTPVPTNEEVKVAVEKLNTQILSLQRELNFSIDENSGRTVVQVIDSETGDVVRQIPTDQILKLAQQIDIILSEVGESVSGLLLEEQA